MAVAWKWHPSPTSPKHQNCHYNEIMSYWYLLIMLLRAVTWCVVCESWFSSLQTGQQLPKLANLSIQIGFLCGILHRWGLKLWFCRSRDNQLLAVAGYVSISWHATPCQLKFHMNQRLTDAMRCLETMILKSEYDDLMCKICIPGWAVSECTASFVLIDVPSALSLWSLWEVSPVSFGLVHASTTILEKSRPKFLRRWAINLWVKRCTRNL